MPLHLDGLREITKALERAGVDVNEQKDVLGSIATEAADTMRRLVPVATGKTQASIRPNRAKGRAIVTLGGPKAPGAHVIRATHPSKFVQRTDEHMSTRAAEMLEAGWTEIAKRNGLL